MENFSFKVEAREFQTLDGRGKIVESVPYWVIMSNGLVVGFFKDEEIVDITNKLIIGQMRAKDPRLLKK
jgi:hypothetical protein